MVTRILALMILLVSPWVTAVDRLSASVDRNPAMAGETILLEVVAEGDPSSNQLDTSALSRDFIVGRTSASRNTQIINGAVSNKTSWSIALMVRNPGTYQIPAFHLDGQSSEPITLEVVKRTAGNTQSQPNQDLLLKSTISATTAYVGQQLIYTSTLYLAVDLKRGNLEAPVLPGADVIQFDDDQEGTEIVNGRRYRTITRSFTITPNQAGELELTGTVFRGDVQVGRSGFFNAGRSKAVSLMDDNMTLTIKAIPDNFPGQWLVSDIVVLQEEWPENLEFRVGEPVTRTLKLTATNVNKEQLPEIPQSYPPQMQLYPDKPQSNQVFQDNRYIAQSSQSLALIPTQAGRLILPELRLPWWNSQTHSLEWATLPAKTINVLPPLTKLADTPATVAPTAPQTPNAPVVITTASPSAPWWPWSTATFALLWLITLALLFRQRRPSPQVQLPTPSVTADMWPQLVQACRNKQTGDITRLMPLWLHQELALELHQLRDTAPQLLDAYRRIQQASYGAESASADTASAAFKTLLKELQQLKNRTLDENHSLKPLYPV